MAAKWSQRLSKGIGIGGDGHPLAGFPIDPLNRMDYCIWFNDFLTAADYDSTQWTESDIGTTPTGNGVGITADSACGELLVNAGTDTDKGISSQFTGTGGAGEIVVPADSKSFAFGCRAKINDVNEGAFIFGLCDTDTTLIATGSADAVTNGIYWMGFDKSGDSTDDNGNLGVAWPSCNVGGTEVYDTSQGSVGRGFLPTVDTYTNYAFHTTVVDASANTGITKFYTRDDATGIWVLHAFIENNIPNAGLCVSVGSKNDGTIVTNFDLTLDNFWVAIER